MVQPCLVLKTLCGWALAVSFPLVMLYRINRLESNLREQQAEHQKEFLKLTRLETQDTADNELASVAEGESAEKRRLDTIIKVNVVDRDASDSAHDQSGCVTVNLADYDSQANPYLLDLHALCGGGAHQWKCPNCFIFNGNSNIDNGFVCIGNCSSPMLTSTLALGESPYTTGVFPIVFINGQQYGSKYIHLTWPNSVGECDFAGDHPTKIKSHGALVAYCLKGLPAGDGVSTGYGAENQLYAVQTEPSVISEGTNNR